MLDLKSMSLAELKHRHRELVRINFPEAYPRLLENEQRELIRRISMSENDEPITRPDGFRPRRKRERGWLKAAIKDGSVRDPDGPPDEHIDYSGTGATVISVPVAALDGEGT